jgi:hypothetical protein
MVPSVTKPTMLLVVVFVVATALVGISADTAAAHQSGCHRWHSCPSDYDTYQPGDLGYPVQYPANCGWQNCGGETPYQSGGSIADQTSLLSASSDGAQEGPVTPGLIVFWSFLGLLFVGACYVGWRES